MNDAEDDAGNDAEDELWDQLGEAGHRPPGPEHTALLERIVQHSDLDAMPELAVAARRALADVYCADGRWAAVFRMFDECLAAHDRQPWRFTRLEEDGLLGWYVFVADAMADFPRVPLPRIEHALHDVERRLRAGGRDLAPLHAARRRLAQAVGDEAGERAAFAAWRPRPGSAADLTALVERAVLRGADGAAYDLAEPVLTGRERVDGSCVPVACLVLLPALRLGFPQAAAGLARFVRRSLPYDTHRYEHLARYMEFCALTGNADAAYDLLGLLDDFETFERPAGRLEYAVAVAVLTGSMLRAGHTADVGETPLWLLHERMRDTATELAAKFDARNGGPACGDRVRARLDAAPLEFLPLTPGAVRPVDPRPPAGLSDAELLDRARRHDQRCEPDEARACLAAVREAPGALAAHLVELRAMLHQGPGTADALRWAIACHRQYGDETRALLATCWLGLLPGEPAGTTAGAAAALRARPDDRAAAWGDHWLAYDLMRAGRDADAFAALRRGAARAAADPLIAGSFALLAAAWGGDADPAAAADALVTAGAGRKAVEALDLLADPAAYAADRLCRDLPPVVHGHLLYLRARELAAAGRAAETADDLAEAAGVARAHRLDSTAAERLLVAAHHAAGRWVETVDAAVAVAGRLDGDAAAEVRLLCADAQRRCGLPWAALAEYAQLPGHPAAEAAAAELRRELGLPG
ncbi:hypothetical protein [Spirilliplanes yamanashiensis]|uniref:Uncharacterized protein n=1 Tax=Spirilliplanes yamanashiensis TaxID=42233 RepID=A0A8J3Y508_9ACTN|nr:hypothetical protein [Spirilliplanes yamanashiensis]MDP9819270.1 hypothetical protein [Spirilliplanes yamanashiensis]GIJ01906.1 hypothetical protein Sya03_12580 [Spirilliplanes yamanashiensis]